MNPDAQEKPWGELRERLPAARTRAQAIQGRLTAEAGSDVVDLLVAELSAALEELSVALRELDQQHGMVLELQGMLEASSRRSRQALDAVPDAIAITDLRGLVVLADRRRAARAGAAPRWTRASSIEQAKGRLAERLGITEREAFELLRRRARASGTKLQLLAQAVICGELDLP